MNLDITQLWTAAGVLLGFQVTSFSWRITQESRVADKGDISWIPPADYLNLLAMIVTVFGVFVLPLTGITDIELGKMLFGLGAVLFVGHSFAIAGHYELFNNKTKRSYSYFPKQEKIVVSMVSFICFIYLVLWLFRE